MSDGITVPEIPEDEVKAIIQSMSRRWKAMGHIPDIRLKGEPLWYMAGRDVSCFSQMLFRSAVRLAAAIRPDLASGDYPLMAAEQNYVSLFTEGDNRVDALINAIPCLLRGNGSEDQQKAYAESFVLFCVCYMIVFLIYMLLFPNLADTLQRRWPETMPSILDGITSALFMEPDERNQILRKMVQSGVLPACSAVADMIQAPVRDFVTELIEGFKKQGFIDDSGPLTDVEPTGRA